MAAIRVVVVAEDLRLAEFVVPALERLGATGPDTLRILVTEHVHGCRPRVLAHRIEGVVGSCDLLVVAADASAPGHQTRSRSHRQKRRRLASVVAPAANPCFAIAAPSVEAWLLADRDAFLGGLHAGTGTPVTAPATWPAPRDETEAKTALGRVVHDVLGSSLPRAGFEYARSIVARARLEDSDSPSLADWARDVASRLRSIQERP